MSGRILALARKEANRIVTSGGFEDSMELSTPNQDITVNVTGFSTKHWISYDESGNTVNAKNAHICVSEQYLQKLLYPVRNTKGEVSLINHIVSVADSTGEIKKYVIKENYPDETLGLITCILRDFTNTNKLNPTSEI